MVLEADDDAEQQALDALREYCPKQWEVYRGCVLERRRQWEVGNSLGIDQRIVSKRLARAEQLIAAYKRGIWRPEDGRFNVRTAAQRLHTSVQELQGELALDRLPDPRAGRPMPTRKLRSQWSTDPWFREIDHWRRKKGWTLERLGQEAGVSGKSLRDHERQHTAQVLRLADALDIDRSKALRLAKKPIPDVLGRKLLECEMRGESRDSIAARLGVSRRWVEQHISCPGLTVSDSILDRITPELQLTAEEAQDIRDLRHSKFEPGGELARARSDSTDRSFMSSPAYKEKRREQSVALWETDREKMESALKDAGKSLRVEIPSRVLEPLLDQGKTYVEIVEILRAEHGIRATKGTVGRRAKEYGLQSAWAKRRAKCRRAARARAGKSNLRVQRVGALRREIKERGSAVLTLREKDIEDLARKHHIGKDNVRDYVKQARAAVTVAHPDEASPPEPRSWQKLDAIVRDLGLQRVTKSALRQRSGYKSDLIEAYMDARKLGRNAS